MSEKTETSKFIPRIGNRVMRPTTENTELAVGRTVVRMIPTPCRKHRDPYCRKGCFRDNSYDGDIMAIREARAERRNKEL